MIDKTQQARLRNVYGVQTELQINNDGGIEFGDADNSGDFPCRFVIVREFQALAFRDVDTGRLVVAVRQGSPLPNLAKGGGGPPYDVKTCLLWREAGRQRICAFIVSIVHDRYLMRWLRAYWAR
ncbi:hypothetical protein A247_01065 [Pseudomonas syringae pv. actinidiae ICMP 19099]|uniref:Uncharacterized protein n=1 Tax=Pseudomonas syringae pv. actinidiae ICMP 19096 TaxID=1194405 RepID=A0A656JKQ5_PSESF|nr:hypothetical protein A247_01065 [Pseudomonas syringae pv. actinidiae ICMP 19099]EPN34217.1 hypothetical protein A245_42590 [Pseudomonas syringae pv. actinidiae ICMP 19096]EPN46318.1 hypothetical protein A242_00955 [Pseudomonas syringae pv. actinidiae ICMP 19095]